MVDTLLVTIRELLQSEFGIDPESVRHESSLESLGMDSLHAVALLLDIESRLDVTLGEISLSRSSTVGDLIEVIEMRLRSQLQATR
jgi:acyl carrier protein